jgi:hypothetical protein
MEDMNFNEMRQQMAVLKEQLDKQEIVNDRLIRETMKTKSKDIRSTKNVIYFCTVLCLVLYPFTPFCHIWSWGFAIATCVMVVFCAVATHYIHRPVEKLNYMTDDLATVAGVMAKFKKQYDNWLHYVTPALIIPWLGCACYEIGWKNAPEGSNPMVMIIFMLIGAAIGGFVGYRYHCKAVNAAKSIMEQIEE